MTDSTSPPDILAGITPRGDETYAPAMFQLRGRIGRVRYLAYNFVFGLLLFVCTVAAMALAAGSAGGEAAVTWLSVAVSALLGVILGSRRFHDMGHARWAAFGVLVPVVNLAVLLWLSCAPGDMRANRFGPAPGPNTRGVIALAWAMPVLFVAGLLAAIALAPHKPNAERARDEMEQAI